MSTTAIEDSELIRSPMPSVFAAMTTSSLIDEWGAGPSRFQAKPGGRFFLWDGEMEGMIVEISPPDRLVFTLRESDWDASWRDSLVLFSLAQEHRGTRLSLKHSGFSDRRVMDRHRDGWGEYYIGPLKAYCEEHFRM